jgi:hypothetical protein
VEEEFGSDLSDNKEDEVMGTKTTIKIGIDAKASLAKEIKRIIMILKESTPDPANIPIKPIQPGRRGVPRCAQSPPRNL